VRLTLVRVVITAGGLWLAGVVVPGVRLADGLDPLAAWGTMLAAALVLTVVRVVAAPARRALLRAADCPTLAVAAAVLSDALLYWVAGWLTDAGGLAFSVGGFPAALCGSLLLGLVGWLATPVLSTGRFTRPG